MKPEEQRIAIAEAYGWKYVTDGFKTKWFAPPDIWKGYLPYAVSCDSTGWDTERIMGGEKRLPDYLNDLNVILDCVRAMTEDDQWAVFTTLASLVSANVPAATATAAQWSEAFLRVSGKWTD